MVGVVVVTHGPVAAALVEAARGILGDLEGVASVGFGPSDGPGVCAEALRAAVGRVDDGDGALVLADMFGGTPCNTGLGLMGRGAVEVVAGVNLPMLLGVLGERSGLDLAALGARARSLGAEGVVHASALIRDRLRR